MDADNHVILPARYDEITPFAYLNKEQGHHLFILRQANKYSFALKQFRETRIGSTYGFESHIDSIKWFFSEDDYDTLYVLGQGIPDKTIPSHYPWKCYDNETNKWKTWNLSQGVSHYVLAYKKENKYGLITFEHTRKEIEKKHKPGGLGSDYDYWKAIYSFTHLNVHPLKYDGAIIPSTSNTPIVTQNNGKYGILQIGYTYEVPPQFDSIPVQLKEFFYCAKKNRRWGIIFLQEQDSVPLQITPYQYPSIKHIDTDFRYLEFESANSGEDYPACVYVTTNNTALHLQFIVNRLYLRDSESLDELTQTKNITFIPKSNGQEIIQEEGYEYLVATDENYPGKRENQSVTFFVIKTERFPHPLRSHNYSRYSSIDKSYGEHQKISSIITYRLENDTFSLLHEFPEVSEKAVYHIVNAYQQSFILKQTIAEQGKYQHEFYSNEGVKLYEITTNYPIHNWQQKYNEPILEFYTEVAPKTESKTSHNTKKITCYYNMVKKQFYK